MGNWLEASGIAGRGGLGERYYLPSGGAVDGDPLLKEVPSRWVSEVNQWVRPFIASALMLLNASFSEDRCRTY
ncbi:hypothetical protein GCM10007981_10520 [Thermocladium modestius]|uniref:Uncharacterized protein n=1 Tax=Thermocladium modestius TaxID=62609 RepID=A0A830GTG8_9CREN|nr:hypothetical protein [Thermocladium modestius]GGP20836.1 hypothetical protein GCM10007981_10520 [Thermocladium modestius]